MADVLIVCVREDETQAKSLADMFERAGFSVGGAPSSEAALRSSGAAIVVWSQASIRSRPFLDAAQRVVNAGKAVIASLIEPPPASSLKDSPAFDLQGWAGDPDDPSLDPLYFAVDRMVNAARVAAGGAPVEPAPAAFEAPPSLARAPAPAAPPPYARAPQRTAPPAAQTPPAPHLPPGFQMRAPSSGPAARSSRYEEAPSRSRYEDPAPRYEEPPAPHFEEPRAPAPQDSLGSEAEHWRAIRHSRDPTDFLDYLAKYGPQGAFAELAEFRLRQLEPQPPGRSGREAPRERDLAPEPAPAPRSLGAAPQRRPDLAPRRTDPPLPPRRRDPGFDRPRGRGGAVAEPARDNGGALRAFVLFLLLGGAAVGAGLYLGVGQQTPAFSAPVASDNAATNFPEATEEPAAYELSTGDEAENAPAQPERSTRRDTSYDVAALNEPSRPATARAPEREPARQAPPPAVTQPSASTQTSASGPTSLQPRDISPSATTPSDGSNVYTGSGSIVPLTQPGAPAENSPTVFGPAPSASAPAPATTIPAGSVVWAQRPAAERINALYPRRALREGTAGRVVLDCTVRNDLGVSCTVQSETPIGAGFGRAALTAATSFRAQPRLDNGQPSPGSHSTVAFNFRSPD